MRLFSLLLLAVLSLAFAPAPFPKSMKPDLTPPDLKAMKGDWLLLRCQGDGRWEKADGKATVRVAGHEWSATWDGALEGRWKIELDASGEPKAVDFRPASGAVVPAIYRLNGDTLTICEPTDAPWERPKVFYGGRTFCVEVYERQKP